MGGSAEQLRPFRLDGVGIKTGCTEDVRLGAPGGATAASRWCVYTRRADAFADHAGEGLL